MDILGGPLEYDTQKIDSRYRLVILATQRAQQLMEGSRPLAGTKRVKPASIGIEEVCAEHVTFLTGEEAQEALQKAARLRDQEISRRPFFEIDTREITKDLNLYLEASGGASRERTGKPEA